MEDQKKTAREIQQVLLDKHYNIPLVTPAIYNVTQPWVNGWHINGGIQIYLNAENAVSLWIDTDKQPKERK